ncbi:hypothetical protein CASFOL_040311 [Castilleja foliolosa]|uniref:Uncharacterized protein n=2 Tax=Castilleja foliolosa TaxID=1961234 RepID=A0ABD3BFC2_9LAMI
MGSIAKKGLQQYLGQLQKHPLRTKVLTAGVLSAISDIVAQKLSGIQKLQLKRTFTQSVFAGFPNMDLRTGIETAGDSTQMGVRVEMVGTQFGVGPRGVPMSANISLANDGWICPAPILQGLWRTFEIGQTGFFTEVELELKEKKAGRLGGMKNWKSDNERLLH